MKSILSDSDGNLSSNRLIFVLGWILALGVWLFESITGAGIPELPESLIWLLGILTGGKVGQKIVERERSGRTSDDAPF
ncbi:MAG: hypothetical protein FJY67_01865 [Calditrichaeota bacterium]|nr:hypothetical protein [Calditrichota bacterium]